LFHLFKQEENKTKQNKNKAKKEREKGINPQVERYIAVCVIKSLIFIASQHCFSMFLLQKERDGK
jgi:hypothetical protein